MTDRGTKPLDRLRGSEDWTRQDLQGALAAALQPKGSAVVVVGDVDGSHVESLIKTSFGAWTSTTPAPSRKFGIVSRGKVIRVLDFAWTQAAIAVAVPAPRVGTEDETAFAMLASIVAGTPTSSLMSSLRAKSGRTYSVHGRYYPLDGAWVVSTSVDLLAVRESVEAILSDFQTARQVGPTLDEIEKTRTCSARAPIDGSEWNRQRKT